MKRVLFLCVLTVVAGASSAAAQDGDIARALDDIAWELGRLDRDIFYGTPGLSGGYSLGGYSVSGYLPTFQAYRPPTRKQVKHAYRAQHAAAVRAGTAKRIQTTVVAHKGPRF